MLKITEYPKVIETKCIPVEEPWSDLTPSIYEMNEYVKAYNGLGLAAPQIGDFRTYFIMRHNNLMTVFINPQYEVLQAPWSKNIEGCYSLPGKRYVVKRPSRIKAEWTDLLGQRQHCILTGTMAVIFMHEMKHLESQCICDYGKEAKRK